MKLIIAYVLIFLFSSFINVCESSDSLIYCDNRPNVTIDSIVKLNDGRLYVTTDNLYARVLSVTSDHLPIIADGYPKLIDDNFKELQIKYTNMSALNYEFNGTQYYLKVCKSESCLSVFMRRINCSIHYFSYTRYKKKLS
jgi:hypothetical protein